MENTQTSSIDSFQPLLESSRKHLQWPKWRLQRWQTEYWGLRSADYIRTTANLENPELKATVQQTPWTLTELGFPRSSAIKFVVSLWNSAGTSLTFVDNSKTGIFKETRIQRSLKVLQLAPSCGPWNQEIRCVRHLKMSFKFLDFLPCAWFFFPHPRRLYLPTFTP